MKFITETCELEGKTIIAATFVSCDEALIITFGDDTCIHISNDFYGDFHDMVCRHDADYFEMLTSGIITQEEYDLQCEQEEAARAKRTEVSELAQLAKLKEKYDV